MNEGVLHSHIDCPLCCMMPLSCTSTILLSTGSEVVAPASWPLPTACSMPAPPRGQYPTDTHTKQPPQASAAAIKAHGAFTVALSGGSLVKSLAPLADRSDIDFSRWHVLFADERNVAHDSPDSNLLAAREGLLSKIPVPAEQVLAIREGVGAALAATHYAGLLLNLGPGVLPVTDDGQPRIDLVLLGESQSMYRGGRARARPHRPRAWGAADHRQAPGSSTACREATCTRINCPACEHQQSLLSPPLSPPACASQAS